MKKFTSYFLISIITVFGAVQIFAQDLNYKPAISFEYDTFKLGKTDRAQFLLNLENDLLTPEEYILPADLESMLQPGENDAFGSSDNLKKAYNDLLYYSNFPEISPLYNSGDRHIVMETKLFLALINKALKEKFISLLRVNEVNTQINEIYRTLRKMEKNTKAYRNKEIEISLPKTKKEMSNYEYYSKLVAYYALRFIWEELHNKNDRFRYERAIIDLASIYGKKDIQITDKRPEAQSLTRKGILLTRAEVNYLVQLIDIYNQEQKQKKVQSRIDSDLDGSYKKTSIKDGKHEYSTAWDK